MSTPDLLPALVAERMKIWHSNDFDQQLGLSEEEIDRRTEIVCDQVNELDNRIADIVAPSTAGILAQLDLLIEFKDEAHDWTDGRDRRLMEAIKTGVGNLTGDAKNGAPDDPFALGGRQEVDELVLSLFRQWIAVCDEASALDDGATDDEREPYYQRRDEIEDEIMATPGGAVALAIKAYFLVRVSQDGGYWAPRLATLRLDESECRDIDVSVLRNAAALVPEIGELAAAIIHEDAALIDLDMEVTWARTVLAGERPCWPSKTQVKLDEALNRIALAEAKTERGEAIKARHAPR